MILMVCLTSRVAMWMFPQIVVPPNHPIFIGFSILNHPFWGVFPLFLENTHVFKKNTPSELNKFQPKEVIGVEHRGVESKGGAKKTPWQFCGETLYPPKMDETL